MGGGAGTPRCAALSMDCRGLVEPAPFVAMSASKAMCSQAGLGRGGPRDVGRATSLLLCVMPSLVPALVGTNEGSAKGDVVIARRKDHRERIRNQTLERTRCDEREELQDRKQRVGNKRRP